MSNSSSISHFLLLALADMQQLQLLPFCLLLAISLAALLGNGLIIRAVACSHHLHMPMFFFLLNLALSDLGSICTTVPKATHNSLWGTPGTSPTEDVLHRCKASHKKKEKKFMHQKKGSSIGKNPNPMKKPPN